MSDRETKEFITPGNHTIVLRTYLTGREANELKAIMFAALKVNMDDAQTGKVGVGEVPASFLMEQERKALGFLVVSVDGNASAPLDQLDNLPSTELAAVVAEVNKIQNPTTPEKVKAAWRRYFSNGVVEWQIQLIAILCKEMSWTYETYLSQPQEFVLILLELLRAEAQHVNSKV